MIKRTLLFCLVAVSAFAISPISGPSDKIIGPAGAKVDVSSGNASITAQAGGSVNITNGDTYVPSILDFSTSVTPTLSGAGHAALAFDGTNLKISKSGGAYTVFGAGATIPSTTNLLIGDGAGNASDSTKAAPSGAVVGTTDTQTLTNKTIDTPKVTTGINDTNANSMLAFTPTTSAVDGFTFTNGAAGNAGAVSIKATGSDTNIGFNLYGKGGANNGGMNLYSGTVSGTGATLQLKSDENLAEGGYGNGARLSRTDIAYAVKWDFSAATITGPIIWAASPCWLGSTTKPWTKVFSDQYLATQTITAGGTTGAQTINKSAGTVNFAAAATSLVVTDSLVTTNSTIYCSVRTNDTTAYVKNVVPSSGSFTITLGAAATAETSVGFFVVN